MRYSILLYDTIWHEVFLEKCRPVVARRQNCRSEKWLDACADAVGAQGRIHPGQTFTDGVRCRIWNESLPGTSCDAAAQAAECGWVTEEEGQFVIEHPPPHIHLSHCTKFLLEEQIFEVSQEQHWLLLKTAHFLRYVRVMRRRDLPDTFLRQQSSLTMEATGLTQKE